MRVLAEAIADFRCTLAASNRTAFIWPLYDERNLEVSAICVPGNVDDAHVLVGNWVWLCGFGSGVGCWWVSAGLGAGGSWSNRGSRRSS